MPGDLLWFARMPSSLLGPAGLCEWLPREPDPPLGMHRNVVTTVDDG